MNRIDRLFGIVTMLQSKKYVAAEQIAEKFEISVRTVYRDVRALCEQGIPVSFEQHRGYYIVQGYFLPPVSFTQEEAAAFLLMEKFVTGFADLSIKAHYASAFRKVKAVLRGAEKERIELLAASTRMHVPECMRSDFDYLAKLQQAISAGHILAVEYKNNNGIASTRQVEPIGLVFYAAAWHVIAWCHLRNEYRDFKVARITRLSDTGLPFRKQPHISLNDYIGTQRVPTEQVI